MIGRRVDGGQEHGVSRPTSDSRRSARGVDRSARIGDRPLDRRSFGRIRSCTAGFC